MLFLNTNTPNTTNFLQSKHYLAICQRQHALMFVYELFSLNVNFLLTVTWSLNQKLLRYSFFVRVMIRLMQELDMWRLIVRHNYIRAFPVQFLFLSTIPERHYMASRALKEDTERRRWLK